MNIGQLMVTRMGVGPDLPPIVLLFFLYSLLGYCLECVVLTVDERRLVLNRGFTSHLPFCVIYGFGAMAGYALLSPLENNIVPLFIMGAAGATGFEYLTARLQLRLFGNFWWDYSKKPFNYKGVLCLESTLGWGLAAIVIVRFVHRQLAALVVSVPDRAAALLAAVLAVAYTADFIWSARAAGENKRAKEGKAAMPEEEFVKNGPNGE